MIRPRSALLGILLLASPPAMAGGIVTGEVSFAERAREEALRPALPVLPRGIHPPRSGPADPVLPHDAPLAPLLPRALRAHPLALSPALAATFPGVVDEDRGFPPDTQGAVGPNRILTVTNTAVRIHARDGTPLSTVSLNGFLSGFYDDHVFDPRAGYDRLADRFYISAAADPHLGGSSVVIAASKGPDPAGAWNVVRADVDPLDVDWADYPTLGWNDRWVALQANLWDAAGSFRRSQLWLFDKADLLGANSGALTSFSFPLGTGKSQVPAQSLDPEATLYLLQAASGDPGTLRLYAVSGTTPKVAWTRNVNVADKWERMPANEDDLAPQSGTGRKVQLNDHTLSSVVLRDGSLFTAQTIFTPLGTPTRSSVQWWEISTGGALRQRGKVEDPAGQLFFAYGSIAVNRNGDALVGFTRFSAAEHPSAAFAFRYGADPPGSLRAVTTLQAGEASYVKTAGSQNRWGDYSVAAVDPANDVDLLTLQEYAASPADHWATVWGRVVPAPCGADGSACDDGNACTGGDTCRAGSCSGGTRKTCPPPAECHVGGDCDPATGDCVDAPLPDGTACDDGDPCTHDDACAAGACKGTPLACPAAGVCLVSGACDAKTGTCLAVDKPDGTKCPTGSCRGGVCVGAVSACGCGGGASAEGLIALAIGLAGATRRVRRPACQTGAERR